MHRNAEVPVLIVGGGPVGSTLALELAHHGVANLVVERSVGPSPYPKMDFVNARSMELLSRLGVVDEIRDRGVPPEYPFTFVWSRTFAEAPVTRWTYPSVDGVRSAIARFNDGTSPAEPYQRLTGSVLEDILRSHARDHHLVELREGWTVVGLAQDSHGVTAVAVDRDGVRYELRARFLVGCDGAGSKVRDLAGIPVRVDGPIATHCDVYFESADPRLRSHGRFFLAILGGGLTLVSRDERHTWTAAFPLPEGGTELGDPVATVKARLGIDFEIDRVIDVAHWEGRLAVAGSYRRGAVFLAGDAAHQFYPTGGHGANTGLADAVDLGWKLAAHLTGWGGERLLDSYQSERRPVALFNREMCFNLLEVWRRFPVLAAEGATREHLAGFLAQDSYQIDNVGLHCGYRYAGSPVVCYEDGDPPQWDWRRIVPTTWPGGRAPSLRLADGSRLYDQFGTGFTLVDMSADRSGVQLAAQAASRRIPISHLRVEDAAVRRAWERNLVLVRPDHHVAWRADTPPADWATILATVSGHG